MEHPHTGGIDVELAAIRGHRLHDAEGELRLVGELAGMNCLGAGLGKSMKSVDCAEPSGNLGPIHPAHGCTKRIADGHAEQCAEELILCCVWHLTHPNPRMSACTSLTLNWSNPRLPACNKGRHSGQEPRFDIVPNERGNIRGF